MTHDTLTEPSLSPHHRKGREGNREEEGNRGPKAPSIVTEVTREAATMDGRSAADHVHRFVPAPAGRLYGKVLCRNRCACGEQQHPAPPKPLERGPSCRRCGFPTAAGTVDLDHPLHPCCAEPALMALARPRKARR